MRVVLVDDHPVVRKGLKSLLEEHREYRVAGEAATGAEAIELVKQLKPDVVILDLKLPDMNGLLAAGEIKLLSPDTRIIILSMYANDFYVEEAFRSGADGYVVKDALEREIIEALDAAVAGRRYLSEALSASVAATRIERLKGHKRDHYESLTNREREIFYLIAQGFFNKDIALQLSISVRTVETHRANIMRKLNLRTPAELIHFAVRRKIIKMP